MFNVPPWIGVSRMAASLVSKDGEFWSVRGFFLFKTHLVEIFRYNNKRLVDNYFLEHRKIKVSSMAWNLQFAELISLGKTWIDLYTHLKNHFALFLYASFCVSLWNEFTIIWNNIRIYFNSDILIIHSWISKFPKLYLFVLLLCIKF